MKIALITDGITPYVLGGMQRHSFYLAKYLAQNKVTVDLFHFNQSNFDIEKLDVFSEEEKKYINSVVVPFPKTIKFPGHYIYESYLYSKKIFEHIKSELHKYDFIYTKGFAGWKIINEKDRGLKMPIVGINVHGYEMFQKVPSFKSTFSLLLLRAFIKPLFFKSDKVFSYGGKITSLLTDSVRIPKQKIIEISGGIEDSWLNENQKSISTFTRFIFLGRPERRKGIEELNEALNRIKDKYDFHFTFIGPIPGHLKIVSPKISYWGEIRDTNRLKQILFEHDVLVCPSHSEGMPNVILEAMANQLAIISTNVGAVKMMVSEENGWLLPQVNVDLLEKVITQTCKIDKQKLQQLQSNSLKKVKENFLWKKIIQLLIEKTSKD